MKATLDHLRPLRDDSIRRRRGSQAPPAMIDARFLVLDVTVPVCIDEAFRVPTRARTACKRTAAGPSFALSR
ncbi:MAG: hypothetical protein EHM55_05785 [Acidobacteria bacterium]|nr:MAG: hypothetical protein EHM55_05785 [Acidobacteriota bacterium]